MLSYRHAYHAGNFADVLKHLTLTYLLDYLGKKSKPYTLLDTHSGAGQYPLQAAAAQQNAEHLQGIARLWQQPVQHPLLQRYLNLLYQLNPAGRLSVYPGSPRLAQLLLRDGDHLLLNELHPQELKRLHRQYDKDARVRILAQDGFDLLKSQLPFQNKRGLILLDPSYELKTDYTLAIQALVQGYRRFATGSYALWYPVLNRQATEAFVRSLTETGIPDLLRIEHCPEPDTSGMGMSGSGMLLINPPYTLAEDYRNLLPELDQYLADGKGKWLVKTYNPTPQA